MKRIPSIIQYFAPKDCEKKRLKTVLTFNALLLSLLSFGLVDSLLNLILQLYFDFYLTFSLIISSIIALFLNKKGYFLWAKLGLIIHVLSVIFLMNAVYSIEPFTIIFIIPTLLTTFIIFTKEERYWRNLILISTVVLLGISIISEFRIMPISMPKDLLIITWAINIIGSTILSLIAIQYQSKINDEYESHIQIKNAQITNQNQVLKSSVKTRDKLISLISHDVRTPIGNIIMTLKLLDSEIPEDKKQWVIHQLKKDAETTMELLDSMLEWARSQNQVIEFEPKNYSVGEIISKATGILLFAVKSKKIQIHHQFDPSVSFYGDASMIESVFRNLLSNAIKFTRDQGDISIAIEELEDQIRWKIADNGIGISEDDVLKISNGQWFTQTGTHQEKGHGVGLLLVKEFLNKNGSKLQVESVLGEGTTFFFDLPKSKP